MRKLSVLTCALLLSVTLCGVHTANAVTTTAMGAVMDTTNNTPCGNAWVFCNAIGNSVYADSDGLYIIENFELGSTRTTAFFGVTKTGFANNGFNSLIVPGAINTITAYIYKGGVISGRVTSHEGGSPAVSGATINASVGMVYSKTYTQADGSYQFRLIEGTAQIYVVHENYADSLKTDLNIIETGTYPNTDFQLYVGGTVTGVVYLGDTAITVPSFTVSYVPAGSAVWPIGSTPTGSTGVYTLEHVYPGYIDITTPNLTNWVRVERKYVPVNDGQTTAGIDLRLGPAGSVAGTITAYTSAPVNSAKVTLTRIGSINETAYIDHSNAEGFYAESLIPEGFYDVTVRAPQGLNLQTARVNNVEIVNLLTTTMQFTLQAGGTVEGYITGIAGNPMSNALVTLHLDGQYPQDTLVQDYADVTGRYQFDGLTPYLSYTINVNASTSSTINASAVRRGLTFSENETSTLNFQLPLGGSVQGDLYSYLNQLNEGTMYSYLLNSEQTFRRLISSVDYTIYGLPENNYFVCHFPVFGDVEYSPYVSAIKVTAEQMATQDVTMPKGATLSGFVYLTEAGGNTAPAAGVTVQVKNSRTILSSIVFNYSQAKTDGGGYYTIARLGAGEKEIYIIPTVEEVGGYASQSRIITFDVDSPAPENFTLQQTGVKISGVIRNSSSIRVNDSMVYFWNTGGENFRANADDRGRYSLMLKPGTYTYQGYYSSLMGDNYTMNPVAGLSMQSGQNTENDIILEDGGVLSGIIKDQLGNGVDLAQIIISVENNPTPVRFGLTDESGFYKIYGLHSATYQMEVQAAGYASNTREFTATLGEDIENVDLIIIAQTSIAGRVRTKSDRVPKEAVISLLDSSNGAVLLQTSPNSNGEYILSPLSGGPYSVKATALGMKASTLTDVYAGDRADFTLESLIGKEDAISYPNPARGANITFLYWVEESSTVLIRVYSQSGELVWDWEGPGAEQQYNRKEWNISGVAPGVYIFKITDRNQQNSISRFPTGRLTVIK
jgi:carboxypeptidase family protein/type IX secretion system substrate protein